MDPRGPAPVDPALAVRDANPRRQVLGNANAQLGETWSAVQDAPSNTNFLPTSDTSKFNIYPITSLDNTYLSQQIEYFDPNTVSESTNTSTPNTFTFLGTLPGWAHTSEFYIEFTVEQEVTLMNEFFKDEKIDVVDPLYVNNPKMAQLASFITQYERFNAYLTINDRTMQTANLPGFDFSNGLYPNEPYLQLFTAFEAYGGNNAQTLGRTTMQNKPYIQLTGLNKTSNASAEEFHAAGPPISSIQHNLRPWSFRAYDKDLGLFMPATFSYSNERDHRIQKSIMDAFEKKIRSLSALYSGEFTIDENEGTTTWSNKLKIAIPLSRFNEFFACPAMLPPEFKLKIVMKTLNDWFIVYNGTQRLRKDSAEGINNFLNDVEFKARVSTDESPQIYYRTRYLTPAVQAKINDMWMQNAFTYEVLIHDPIVIKSNTWSGEYKFVAQVSSQRPLYWKIALIANKDGVLELNTDTTAKVKARMYQKGQLMPWIDKDFDFVNLDEFTILISGRTQFVYRNYREKDNQEVQMLSNDMIMRSIERDCFHDLNTHQDDIEIPIKGPLQSGVCGYTFMIPANSGQDVDFKKYAIDIGAVQVNMRLKTSAALHPDIDIVVTRVLPEQYTVDPNQRITVTTWPAVVIYMGKSSQLVQKQLKIAN